MTSRTTAVAVRGDRDRTHNRNDLHAGWRLHAAVLAGYSLIAVAVLWNLLSQATTAVPGGRDTDYFQFHWGYWWLEYSLSHGLSPLWTDYVLYPHTSNLSIHTLAPIWFPLYALLRPLIGRVAAVNAMVLLAFPLAATAMFAWLRRLLEGRATLLALAGGLVFAFSPFLLTHASYTHVNLIPLWWFPTFLLLWDEMAFPRRLRRPVTALLLGLALWGLWLTDLQYLIWIPFAILGYALWTLWATRRNGEWRALVLWGALAVALMLVLAWLYPLAALVQVKPNATQYPAAGLYTLETYSLPPAALLGLAPPVETRTFGHLFSWLVWAALLLAVVDRRRQSGHMAATAPRLRPDKWFWLAMAIPPLILALGPTFTVGSVNLPTPYLLFHNLLGGQHRVPARFTGVTAALLIPFMALAFAPLFDRFVRSRPALARLAVGFACLAVMADAGALQPFPARPVRTYAIHDQIAADPRDYVILDVPTGTHYGWTGLGNGYWTMFYGAFHQHPMVNGWLSRIPYSTLADYENSPLFSWLAGARDLDDAERDEAARMFSDYLRDWPIGYVFAYRDLMDPDQQSERIGWLNLLPGLCPAQSTADGSLLWWRAEALGCDESDTNALDTAAIDIGAASDWDEIGEGWYAPELIGGPSGRWTQEDASLRVEVEPNTDYEITFSAVAFSEDRELRIDGIALPQAISHVDWRDYALVLPARVLTDSILVFDHDGATSTATLGLSDNLRELAVAYNTITLRPITP